MRRRCSSPSWGRTPPGPACRPLRWTRENRLILASASPQRTQILHQLRIPHEVRPTEAPELESGEPFAVAAENARRKGRAGRDALGVAESALAVVLACDTVVALDGRVYGKPADDGGGRARSCATCRAARTTSSARSRSRLPTG